jgi:hypothetical protein
MEPKYSKWGIFYPNNRSIFETNVRYKHLNKHQRFEGLANICSLYMEVANLK